MKKILFSIRRLFTPKNRQGNIRYMFPAVLSFVVMLGAAVVTSTDVSYVRLAASKTTVESGQKFSVDVFAYAHVPVNAVDITLGFDEDAVEVTGVDKGQSVLTIWTEEPIIEDNRVILRGGTFRKGFLREHKIATVNLLAKQTGNSNVKTTEVLLLAGDGRGTEVKVAESLDSKVDLYIYDENTDPESIGVDVKISVVSDLDNDGNVSLKDVSMFMSAWGSKDKVFDFDGDGRMTFRDFSIILSHFFFR